MSALPEFLLARISEDEAAARAGSPGPWVWNTYSAIFAGPLLRPYDEWTDSPLTEDHTLERSGRCKACGRDNGCGLYLEDVRRDPEVVSARAVGGDTPSHRGAADLAHIARWDPVRVLAECAPKRLIIDTYLALAIRSEAASRERADELDKVLRFLAMPYAAHPDFELEWLAPTLPA